MRGRKKNYRYIIGMFLVAFLLIGMAKGVDAKTATSGKCGAHVKWTYKNRTLTISGKGSMKNYKYKWSKDRTTAPWWKYHEKCRKIVVKKGVTSIGNYAFHCFHNVEKVSLGSTVKRIGNESFRHACQGMKTINFPDSLTEVGEKAFFGCSNIKKIVFPASMKKIDRGVFIYCTKLTSVTIKSKYVKLNNDVFYNSSTKLVIYGYENSTAEKLARHEGLQFEALDSNTGFHYMNTNFIKKKWKYEGEDFVDGADIRTISKEYFALSSLNVKKGTATIAGAENLWYVKLSVLNQKKKEIEVKKSDCPYFSPIFVKGLKKNNVYYYRMKKSNSDCKRYGSWSVYRAFITADYKYKVTSKSSLAVKVPKIKGIKNYTVYVSTDRNTGYKKVKTVKPGKSVTIKKYKGKKLKKKQKLLHQICS